MAGLVRRILPWQFAPLCSRAQDPQDSVEYRPRILPRATATVGPLPGPKDWFDQLPLGIAEFPSSSHALLFACFPASRNS
jgi:hypothetical protein